MKWLLGCGTLFALALILFVVPAGLEGPVLVPISPGHGLSLVDVVALVPLLAGTGAAVWRPLAASTAVGCGAHPAALVG